MEQATLPHFFKPILWPSDFNKIDLEKSKKTIIVNAINYGDLKHWKWLIRAYGKKDVAWVLSQIPVYELRKQVRELAQIVFKVKKFNYKLRAMQ